MPASEQAPGALSVVRACSAAALAGCACMVVELSAVRLLAPFFGDSAYVWTNVIGVILLALALGAFSGGRFAERSGSALAARLLVLAAIVLCVVPFVGPIVGDWLLPQDLPLDAAMPALVRGSLAASVALFGPALWLLGAVSPGLVVGASASGAGIGRAAGAVSAAGTIGSLVGTFLATHWLVPHFGCRAAVWSAAAALAVAGFVVRRRPGALAVGGIALLCAALPLGPLRGALAGQELLAEVESRHQYLRVVRTPSSNGSPSRIELKINEGLDSYHSVAVEGRVLTSSFDEGRRPSSYYDYHLIAPLLAGDGSVEPGLCALSIGDAAGTFRRIYAALHPTARVDAVELDPAVVRLGEQWFPGARSSGEMFAGIDGRVVVERSARTWRCIHVDAYSHQVYIPPHLASDEFFAAVHERLEPRGVVACNVGGLGFDDPVLCAMAKTMRNRFSDVAAFRVPDSRNVLLVGRKGADIDPGCLVRTESPTGSLSSEEARLWRRVLDEAATGAWRGAEQLPSYGTAPTLHDDRPLLDELLLQSYLDADRGSEDLAFQGPDSREWAESAAFDAYRRGDFDGTVAAALRSAEASAYLCYLAGAARWSQRRLQAALAHTLDGLAMQPPEPLLTSLASQRDALRAEWAPIARAHDVADRNLVIAAGVSLVAILAALVPLRRSPVVG